MTALFVTIAIAIAGSYFAVIRRDLLFSVGGMVAWIAVWAMIKGHPPLGVTDGEAAHVLMQFAPWVVGIGVMLYSAQKEITRRRDLSGNFSWEETGTKFPFLNKRSEEEQEHERRLKGMSDYEIRTAKYRARVRGALSANSSPYAPAPRRRRR